jgi:hypothetical protein
MRNTPNGGALGYFVPKYPKKGQKYTKSENTPGNTRGIPNGVFNPGYFLSFLRSAEDYQDEVDSTDGTSTYFLSDSISNTQDLNTESYLKTKADTIRSSSADLRPFCACPVMPKRFTPFLRSLTSHL